MRKIVSTSLSIMTAVFLLAGCASAPKQQSIQELIMQGRYDEAKDLFKNKTDINAIDADGNTALHVAARVNEADLVSFLIIKGADTEIKHRASCRD